MLPAYKETSSKVTHRLLRVFQVAFGKIAKNDY